MKAFAGLTKAGRIYMWSVPTVGIAVLAWALYDLQQHPPPITWLALAALTILTGSFTVKIPGLVARLSVSEPFVFAATFLFGPSVGAVTAALDAFIMSLWLLPNLKTFHRIAFNLSVLIISIWASSLLFFVLAGIDPRNPIYSSLADFVLPLYVFTVCCFVLNSGLVATALAFERQQSAFRIWRQQFLWLSLNYFGGASVAALLVLYAKNIDLAVVGIIIPLLVISYLTFRTTLGRLDDANTHVDQLNNLYLSTIETLAMAVDAKDQVTHGHIRRVQRYAVGLAQALGVKESNQIRAVEAAALLHDMGKLAIPEYILNKPGRLTETEFDKMKLHAGIGADILSAVEFPYPVVPIVRHHHENWDGSGYPDRIGGTHIPLGARILSVVDCFDALTSDRPYRPALSNQEALQIIMARRGTMYDPLVVDTFVEELPVLTASLKDIGPQSETLQRIADLNNPSLTVPKHDVVEEPEGSEVDPAPLLALFSSALGSLDVPDVSLILLGRLRQMMSVDACVVFLIGPSGDNLVAAGVAGTVPEGFLGSPVEFGTRIAGWVAANRTPVRNSDPELDMGAAVRSVGLRSSLVCPLLSEDTLRGVIGLYSSSLDAFSAEHLRLIELLSPQIGSFVTQLARTPRATVKSTSSRQVAGWFELREMFTQPAAATESWFPLTVVTLTCQPTPLAASESVSILHAIRSAVRLGDCVFHLTENVFAVLLLRSSDEVSSAIVERLRTSLARQMEASGSRVSIGVQSVRQTDEHIDDVIRSVLAASARPTLHPSNFVH
ncbi:MAG: HD domain-containing phosphohydrolase [Vicinamibacterales bacterium]